MSNGFPAEPDQVRVRIGVIAESVAARDDLANQIRTLAREFADDEESGADLMAVKEIEEAGGYGGIWAVIEGERDRWPVQIGAEIGNDGPEKLRLGGDRAPTRKSGRSNGRHGNCDAERVQNKAMIARGLGGCYRARVQ